MPALQAETSGRNTAGSYPDVLFPGEAGISIQFQDDGKRRESESHHFRKRTFFDSGTKGLQETL